MSAVCKSGTAAELGYKVSLMERLMNRPLYSKHPTTKAYNVKYITQLVLNYRSHEAILHSPNHLFYEDTLKARAPEGLNEYDSHLQLPKYSTNCIPNVQF